MITTTPMTAEQRALVASLRPSIVTSSSQAGLATIGLVVR